MDNLAVHEAASDPLNEQILIQLRRIIRAVDLHSRELMSRHGLTSPQLILLRRLAREAEPVAVGALARAINLSQATVSGIVDRLEARGLVARTRSDEDRRLVVVSLTEAGRQMVRTAPPALQDHFSRKLRALQEWERTQLLASLQRLVGLMAADDIDASPILTPGLITSEPPIAAPAAPQPPPGHT